MSRSSRRRPPDDAPGFSGRAAVLVQRTVTVVVFVIAGLTFAFGFGQGWQLGLLLGVSGWLAPLVAPAVDLSVVALLVATQYVTANGARSPLDARLLLVFCGLTTLALNTAHPLLSGQYGRACFFAVPPLLLIGWSEVGPRLLGLLHGVTANEQQVVPNGSLSSGDVPDGPGSSGTIEDDLPIWPSELLERAYQLDAEHREAVGRPITRDALRARLRVSNEVAGLLLRHLRSSASK